MRLRFGWMILLVLLVVAGGCSSENSDATETMTTEETVTEDDRVMTLSLGTVQDWSGTRSGSVFRECAEDLKEISGGELQIDIYDDGILGDSQDLAQGAFLGTVDIVIGRPLSWTSVVPEAVLLGIGGIFSDSEMFNHLMESSYGETLEEYYRAGGLELLACFSKTSLYLASNERISSAEDLVGVTVGGEPFYKSSDVFWVSLGMHVVTVEPYDIYASLLSGEMDAQLIDYETFCSTRSYRLQKYIIPVNSALNIYVCAMNLEQYNNLSEEQKIILQNYFSEVQQKLSELEEDTTSSGAEVVYPDYSFYAAWSEAKDTALENLRDSLGDDTINIFMNQVAIIQNQ
ncbi:MAG: TRAP transporter substrate-binding protein DctP [Lachnospiraceae bacterium]|nr:TRAP transporter substrate-binding protein DctP [Lachnospiraceae bacterium]MCD8010788.1 TRAP transporter substrate-binding protein DctP [Lachnospiraceae bacterium]